MKADGQRVERSGQLDASRGPRHRDDPGCGRDGFAAATDGVVTECVEDITTPMTRPLFIAEPDPPWWTPIGDFCLRDTVASDPEMAEFYGIMAPDASPIG